MIAATPPPLPFPPFAVRPDTTTHQRRSFRPHRLHFHPISNVLSTIRTLDQHSRRDLFIFINLRTLAKKTSPGSLHWGSFGFQPPQHKGFIPTFDMFAYLQCSQPDVDSLPLFATDSVCFQHLVDSFGKNTGVGGSMTNLYQPKTKHPQKEKAPDRLGGGDPGLGG